jgi:putative oxidoreductase
LFGGIETWTRVGGAMSNFGITFFPVFWGFMAAFSEFFGGIFLILGFLTRPFCVLLTITMIVASTHHLARGDGLRGASHALKSGILFFSLIFVGPGKYSLDQYLRDRRLNISQADSGS